MSLLYFGEFLLEDIAHPRVVNCIVYGVWAFSLDMLDSGAHRAVLERLSGG